MTACSIVWGMRGGFKNNTAIINFTTTFYDDDKYTNQIPKLFSVSTCQHFLFLIKFGSWLHVVSLFHSSINKSYSFYLSVRGFKESEIFSSCIKRHSF